MVVAVALSLNLSNLGQDITQLGIIEGAASRAAAVDAERRSAGDEGGDDGKRDHCDR